ncbi:MAG: glycosyltransferase family 2 protein [Helicobacteraceae bacterium]|nr:glycosyltransferase family 2 protein [Helicobacteraceae bacterium]
MKSFNKNTKCKKVGIVVAIYNVSTYLKECLDSIINQSYKNFEVVLVNDGSSDNSLEIAKKYVAKDSRFILIDKQNGGLSSARNVGIEYFNGSYFLKQKKFEEMQSFQNINNANSSNKYWDSTIESESSANLESFYITNENPYNIYEIIINRGG